jgi:AraC family transcriptional regulator
VASMLLSETTRRYDLDGISIRQGIQPAGKLPSWVPSANSLVLHTARPVTLQCSANGKSYMRRVIPGDIHILPRETQVRFEFSGPSELVLLAFDHASLETVCHDLGQNGSLRLTFQFSLRDGQISSLIHALQEELRAGCVTGEFYIRQLAATLIRYIASRYSNQSAAVAAFSPGGLPPNRLRFVIDHIHQHLGTRLLSKDLASLVQMSPQHFANLFRKSTGRAPHEYVVYERIEEAKRLLAESSMPLMDVSLEAGFANQSHFGDSFRHATGTTPKRYRQCFECFHPSERTNRKAS